MQADECDVRIPASGVVLDATLTAPLGARACVAFAHGSGSSRHSPRNRFVATSLNARGLATLLLDLLTPEEEVIDVRTGELRFDVELLATRLGAATRWLQAQHELRALPLGYFGASTGAAAALIAAAMERDVAAVVSRGGRPDLAARALPNVEAATLLIVGGNDRVVIGLNEQALALLRSKRELAIVPGATHLFEEPGALERVAELAQAWFARYLLHDASAS